MAMNNTLLMKAAHKRLTAIAESFMEALDGIPDEDLAHWRPAAASNGGGEMNTFSGIAAHATMVARFIWEHQVFGEEFARDRESEWKAEWTGAEITEQIDNMLRRLGELIERAEEVDLDSPATTVMPFAPDWTKLVWLVESVDHTSVHLGHVQVQRQIWLAERGKA